MSKFAKDNSTFFEFNPTKCFVKLLAHALLLRSMKEETREREIQLFDLIQVAEEFVSGFVIVMFGSCV